MREKTFSHKKYEPEGNDMICVIAVIKYWNNKRHATGGEEAVRYNVVL